jgi:hypothetical protein
MNDEIIKKYENIIDDNKVFNFFFFFNKLIYIYIYVNEKKKIS